MARVWQPSWMGGSKPVAIFSAREDSRYPDAEEENIYRDYDQKWPLMERQVGGIHAW